MAARSFIIEYKSLVNSIAKGNMHGVDDALSQIKPDLAIILTTEFDSVIWALVFHGQNIRLVYLSSIFGCRDNLDFPPFCKNTIPAEIVSRFKIGFDWMLYFGVRRLKGWIFEVLGIGVGFDYAAKRLSKAFGYPSDFISYKTDYLAPFIRIPEIVLWPDLFGFSGNRHVLRYYVEPSIDIDRKEIPFSWEKLHEDIPLIYCAMGTIVSKKKSDYLRFFKVLFGAARKLPGFQWVLSIGDSLLENDLFEAPSNMVIVKSAPQIGMLRKANIMINHAGANTIKECIFFGVPMLVFPLDFDHFGNAAKVVYHKIGLSGSFKRVGVSDIVRGVNELHKNPMFKEKINEMSEEFKDMDVHSPSLRVIESILNE